MKEDGNTDINPSTSMVNKLKNEWSLLWDSISSEFEPEDPFESGRIKALSLDQVREISKALSKTRKQVNQKIESVNREIDLNAAKLESLRLVGAQEDDTVRRLHELSDQGQALSQELSKLDDRLKMVRETEDLIKKA